MNTRAYPPRSVAVAVSGGMDSLYALRTLHAQGLAAMALHGRFLSRPVPAARDPVPGLRQACARMGLPLHVVDLRERFEEQVVQPFTVAYADALTPNPCAWCNARVKFGLLLDAACEQGAGYLATGHYARLDDDPRYGRVLGKAQDLTKDQSYFLALVPRARLQRALFPLAAMRKTDVGATLAEEGYAVPVPGESQEICFVPDDAYRPFLQSRIALPGPGPIRLTSGQVIGRHNGLWQYTEGQRRGLGIAWQEPLYVLRKHSADNSLIVGGKAELLITGCVASGLNELVPRALWPDVLYVRTRYRQEAVRAEVTVEADRVTARFAEPQTPSAPGQVLAVYDAAGCVLGGAVLTELL